MKNNIFLKNHLINKFNVNALIKNLIQGRFCFYFGSKTILSFNQYKAIIFFCKKKLKFYSKLFIRLTPKYKNTSKAIGIRMGKGKGSLNEIYIPVNEGQIFFEFGFKKGNEKVVNNHNDYLKLLKVIRSLAKLVSYKLAINIKYLIQHN